MKTKRITLDLPNGDIVVFAKDGSRPILTVSHCPADHPDRNDLKNVVVIGRIRTIKDELSTLAILLKGL